VYTVSYATTERKHMTSTEIESTATEPVAFPVYRGNESWTDLASGAVVAPGADLVPGNLLVGVPFIITSVTFRPSGVMNAVTKAKPHYASLEIVTGDDALFAKSLQRGRITAECPIDPLEELVFNEGGTGVYRQIVAAFEAFGWITLPDGPLEGAYGESRMDTPVADWEYTQSGVDAGVDVRFDGDGATVVTAPLRILARRGLRKSEYENDYTKEGVTRYLA
jgi:hypothetical protein